MKTLQSYLSILHQRNELTKEEYNVMRPKIGKLARGHSLSKIRKEYRNISKFRHIADTTGTPQYSAGKFLTNLLNRLSLSIFTLKDYFIELIKLKIYDFSLYNNGYNHVF